MEHISYFSVVSWIFPCFKTALLFIAPKWHILVAILLGTKGIKQSHSGDLHLHLCCLHTTVELRTLQVRRVSSSLLDSVVGSKCDVTHRTCLHTACLTSLFEGTVYWIFNIFSSRSLFSTAPLGKSLCSLRGRKALVDQYVSVVWVSEATCAERLVVQWDKAWLADATSA